MTLPELARLVADMRAEQRAFFNPRTRTRESLQNSKRLERAVDRAVSEILGGDERGQGTLSFPDDET